MHITLSTYLPFYSKVNLCTAENASLSILSNATFFKFYILHTVGLREEEQVIAFLYIQTFHFSSCFESQVTWLFQPKIFPFTVIFPISSYALFYIQKHVARLSWRFLYLSHCHFLYTTAVTISVFYVHNNDPSNQMDSHYLDFFPPVILISTLISLSGYSHFLLRLRPCCTQ